MNEYKSSEFKHIKKKIILYYLKFVTLLFFLDKKYTSVKITTSVIFL